MGSEVEGPARFGPMTNAFLTSADAPTKVSLKRRLKRAERARQVEALALVLPLFDHLDRRRSFTPGFLCLAQK